MVTQIDLIIDRRDDIINLCEMKFCQGKFLIAKKYDDEFLSKRQVFKAVTGTKKGSSDDGYHGGRGAQCILE